MFTSSLFRAIGRVPSRLRALYSMPFRQVHEHQEVLRSLNELMHAIEQVAQQVKDMEQAHESSLRAQTSVRQEWHEAHESSLQAQTSMLQEWREAQQNVYGRIDYTARNLNLVARRALGRKKVIRCVFVIHNMATWDALADIYELMRDDSRFDPIVVSIHHQFPGEDGFIGEEKVSEELSRLGIAHQRLGDPNSFIGLNILRVLDPDVIFRQAPWDRDVPPGFDTENLNFTRLCYVPYFAVVLVDKHEVNPAVDALDLHTDTEYHRACWRIFCENEHHRSLYAKTSTRGDDNVVVTGHPKFDRLVRASTASKQWPISSIDGKAKYRVVWAPHHSIHSDWLGFGTFLETHKDMLTWARESTTCEFVLKAHPALFSAVSRQSEAATNELREFIEVWSALPNTALAEGHYGPLFAASDCLITDGISFIAEYQLFDKPLIYLDSGRHSPFSEVGQRAVMGTNTVRSVAEAQAVVDKIMANGGDDGLGEARREFVARDMLPAPGQSAMRIVEHIATEIEKERAIEHAPAPSIDTHATPVGLQQNGTTRANCTH